MGHSTFPELKMAPCARFGAQHLVGVSCVPLPLPMAHVRARTFLPCWGMRGHLTRCRLYSLRLLQGEGKSPRREVIRSSAGAGVVYPPFGGGGGHPRSIPQGMILDVQPLVKALFCPIKRKRREGRISRGIPPLRKGAKFSPGEILVEQFHRSPPLQRDCVF